MMTQKRQVIKSESHKILLFNMKIKKITIKHNNTLEKDRKQ
jgi:hypothetical protein